jgi:lipoyl(octanoyl) transferase
VTDSHYQPEPVGTRTLCAYFLGALEHEALLALQRRLVYEISGDRSTAAVILCDHPAGITIGREGSRAHIRPNISTLRAALSRTGPEDHASRSRGLIRWVSRGGGVMLHMPGQVACYPLLPLAALGLTPARYVDDLQDIVIQLLRDWNLSGSRDPDRPGVRVNGRRIAHVGVAVRDGVSCFGIVLNVSPELDAFHEVHCDGDPLPMTSLQREVPGRIRIPQVRQRLLELTAERFGFDRLSIFHNPPGALPGTVRHAAPQRS